MRYKNMSQSSKDAMAWAKGKTVLTDGRVRGDKNILSEKSFAASSSVRTLLYKLDLKQHKCECCNLSTWNGDLITFELHHLNGITTDNRIENLQILCPNCHSQTKNFRNNNIKPHVDRTDEEIIKALKLHNNNRRRALIELGMAPKGGNYKRLNKFLI